MSENNEQQIIAFAGSKSAGKSTAARFLHSLAFIYLKVSSLAEIDGETGQLVVNTDKDTLGVFDLRRQDNQFINFMSGNIWDFIKLFGFADPIKEAGIGFGIDYKLLVGSDEDKNTLTHVVWEKFPQAIRKKNTGQMTVRDFCKAYGDLMRTIDPDYFVRSAVERIKLSGTNLAIIDDLRFKNEVEYLKKNTNAKVIYLTRHPHDDDHQSEKDLLDYDQSHFDGVIDNQNLTIHETCEQIFGILKTLGVVEV